MSASLRYHIPGPPLTLRANVVNATGNNYWASTGRGILSQGTPRTFLLSASIDFLTMRLS